MANGNETNVLLKSKILISKVSPNNRKPTKVFTERGLYMLATVLKGERARDITLFGVKTVEEYKEMASSLNDPNFHYDGYHMIPSILKALSVDTVATIV